MHYQNLSVLNQTVAGPSEEVFVRPWNLLSAAEGCLGIAARVSSRTIRVSSTSSTFPAASPCTVDARAGLATFHQGFPVSPQETVNIFFSPAPPPSGHLAGFCHLRARSDLCSHLFPSVLAPP